jgi:hypothetical protein
MPRWHDVDDLLGTHKEARVTLTERGHTTNFIVSYENTLTNGPALADAVLARCEPDLAAMSALFGGLMPAPASLPFRINLVPGGGGGGPAILAAWRRRSPASSRRAVTPWECRH